MSTESHSIRCSKELWTACQETAQSLGKNMNEWLVGWLPECVKYDRLLIREREEQEATEVEHALRVAARRAAS
jgi:hypothetical protein